jgi:uncharacterized protein DUF262
MRTGRWSFRELFGEGDRIEIPVIQRDYAQGREDEHSREVRRRFLEALGKALFAEGTDTAVLDLDFVYGRWKVADRTLQPLDGQQRLTTLFLLHWYVASLDDAFDEFQSWITLSNGGASFTYRTRPAAREFFDALVRQRAPLGSIGTTACALSDWLTDSVWFVRSWRRDPTVRGCLTMLDDIHSRFAACKGVWPRLVSTRSPAIIFHLLLLEKFDLSDDLYIKMNARGKALTQFEVFKAEIEGFVGETFGGEPFPSEPRMSWREYISRQFDNAWTDFLWKHRGNTTDIDTGFMHLIRALAIVRCVNHSDDASLPKQVEQLLATPEPGLPFYKELGCLDRAFVEQLVSVLDTLARRQESPNFLGPVDYMDEKAVFRRVLLARGANQDGGLTLVDWVIFYAWCSFLIRFPQDLESEPMRAAFHDWIRVVRNLTYNSDIDRIDRLVAALRGLGRLSKNCGADFLSRVANGALEESGGFNQQQQREERLKSQLLLRNAGWRTRVERAETHPYFRGDIEFLLQFSDIFDRAAQVRPFKWTDDEDSALQQSFADWYDRVCAVFPENVKDWPAPFPEFLWERALLATGDYLLPWHTRNLSLLDDKDRNASWKRLLRADTHVPDREARRDVVRQVLARVDPKDVVGSLRTIVAAGVQGDDTSPVPGFRGRLIAEPRLIEYCQRRMLRLDEDSVFLLARTQRNGRHVDLYVYGLYLRLRAQLAKLTPFDKIERPEQTGVYPRSRILLRTTPVGPTLAVEKHGAAMQFVLQLPEPDPDVAARLTDWIAEGEATFRRSMSPDLAEAAVLNVVAAILNSSLTSA